MHITTKNVEHLVIDSNIYGLSTGVLAVVEYSENELFPINLYVVSQYDEMEDTHHFDLSMFSNIKQIIENDNQFNSLSNFEKHSLLCEKLNEVNNNSNTSFEFHGYDISLFIKSHCGEDIDSLEVDNNNLICFLRYGLHKQFIQEETLYLLANNKKNPFGFMAQQELDRLILLREKSLS